MIRGRNHHRSEGANSIGVRSETGKVAVIALYERGYVHVRMSGFKHFGKRPKCCALAATGDIIPLAALPDFLNQVFGIGKGLTIAAAQTAARPLPTRNSANSVYSRAGGHAERHLRSASRCNAERVFARC
jgi:hypothetical protein